jgi:hypothetical protein
MKITCPVVLVLDDGSKITMLGTPNMAEQLRGRQIVDATEISGFGLGVSDAIHMALSQALLAHCYGNLALDDKTCSKNFKSSAMKISKKLAGALIRSMNNVLLVLIVEVYGKKESEDPH